MEEPSDNDDEDDDEDSEGSYDDPDLADLEADEAAAGDSDIDSDDALGESDVERFKDYTFRGSAKPTKPASKHGNRAKAADFMSSSDEEDEEDDIEGSDEELDEDEEGSEDEEDMSDGLEGLADGLDVDEEDSASDDDEEEEEEEDEEEENESESESGDEKALPIRGAKTSSAPALGQQSDVSKGVAILQQRKIYDGLLNFRIRLQKALVAANTLPALDEAPEAGSEPYEAAEEAAVKLLNTITTLKNDFGPATKSGAKRRHEEIEVLTPNEAIWEQLQSGEIQLTGMRKETLERWSRKVQTVNVMSKAQLARKEKTLIDALEEQLEDPTDRLAKRTRTPRSCAPVQAAKGVAEDGAIYDDADFYQQLLKELVEQRTVDGAEHEASAVPTVMLAASSRDARTRKNVDRKASKGRKMRFTVHEKLQNFMAPEDRRGWEQPAIDRFFGTLFGQRLGLDEEESADEEMEDLKAEAEGVRLFG